MCLTKARVHFQHSAELLNRLVKVDANYSLQLYPDEGHILRDPRSIQHFKRTVVTYFQSCLKHSLFQDPVEDDDEEDDDWAQCSLPTSWMTLPGLYAILCITLEYKTQEHRSRDQAHQIPSCNFRKIWCMIENCCTQLFSTVHLKVCLFTKYCQDEVD